MSHVSDLYEDDFPYPHLDAPEINDIETEYEIPRKPF